jgi:hypothetical protein
LDKSSPNAGFVLLMFYHLYDGKVLFYVGVVWPPGVPAFESSFFLSSSPFSFSEPHRV